MNFKKKLKKLKKLKKDGEDEFEVIDVFIDIFFSLFV